MPFRYAEAGTEKQFTEEQLHSALAGGKVTLSSGGTTVLTAMPTGRDGNGLRLKSPIVNDTMHLTVIPRPNSLVLLGTDETAVEKTRERHPWSKTLSLDRIVRQFSSLRSLERGMREIEAAFEGLKPTLDVSGWVLTGTPFDPSLQLSGPPTKTKRRGVSLDLVSPAPMFERAGAFVCGRPGAVGLHVESVNGQLACDAFVYALPTIKGWLAVPLPLVAKLIALGTAGAAPMLAFVLDAREARKAVSEMQAETMSMIRWFPEMMHRSGISRPSDL